MNLKKEIGQNAEQQAERYLISKGLSPVARNVHFKTGELDLVMRDGEQLVFVEVRYRKNSAYGSAMESITTSKQQKLIRTALLYCQKNRISGPWRIDVIAITAAAAGRKEVLDWIPSAITG